MGSRLDFEPRSVGRTGVLAAAIVVLAFAGSPAAAETELSPSAPSPLFDAMLRRPSDLDVTMRYAVSAKAEGDLEASIGALERLLFFNPKLASVRFELGALYFRLGSNEMARGYFEGVLQSADASEELKQRAQDYINVVDKRLLPDQWSGFFQTGFRYQTNATLGPTPQSLPGATRPIGFAHPDWDWFALGGLNYVHDFGNQAGDVFEASLLGYNALQFTQTSVNTGFLDLRFGPRFGIFLDTLTGASIKPYAIVNGATLANAPYLGSLGGGLTLHFNWGPVGIDPLVEIRSLSYRSSELYPLASGLTGTLTTAAVQAGGPITEAVRWQARLFYNHSTAANVWFAYDRFGFDVWTPCLVPSLWGGRSWVVTPSFGVSPLFYRQANPGAVPFVAERDLEWRVGVGVDIPLQDAIGLGVQFKYRAINSNIPANTVRDFSISMGPTISF